MSINPINPKIKVQKALETRLATEGIRLTLTISTILKQNTLFNFNKNQLFLV